MNTDLPSKVEHKGGSGAVRGFWLSQTVEFIRHHYDGARRDQLEAQFSPQLRSTIGGLSPGDWAPRRFLIELFNAIARAPGGDAARDLAACGAFVQRRSANEFTKLLTAIATPELLLKKLPLFWERDHGDAGRCAVEFSADTPGRARVRLAGIAGYDHVDAVWLGWMQSALSDVTRSEHSIARASARSNGDGCEYDVTFTPLAGSETEATFRLVRERIAEALLRMSTVGFGDYSVQLKVDLRSRHPLESVFTSLNELIMAFAAEHEQSGAFRRELENHLEIIDKQKAAIQELSTPIIELWEGVLCLPVVGVMDTVRSTEMTASLLDAIVSKKARYAIIDITGIEVMDTRTVDHFMRMAKAVRLLGAECALTGINPHIAQTVVHMGLDLTDIVTHRSLRDALTHYVSSHA